ncbi:MAG: transposase [Kiritimatiellota bacterium]|nr:transposase [Kiritimatiellota bacterium]
MTGLTTPMASRAVREAFDRLSLDGNWHLQAATIMPDHVHALFVLCKILSLDRLVAKLKTLSKIDTLRWQPNYFEHRLRPDELAGSYARYIFLNPYRAGLLLRRAIWPHWIIGADSGNWDFIAGLEDGIFPLPEWLTPKEDIDPTCVGELPPSGMA